MKNICAVLIVMFLVSGCEQSANKQRPTTAYEEKKAAMANMEQESPLKFLKVSGTFRNNLVNRAVIEGEVINKSTLVTYKNIEVQINFKDKEGSSIEKQKHTLEDEVKPGETLDFKIKVGHVSGAESVAIDIVDAVADK